MQSLLQVSDGSVRFARGGVAVLNKNIGVPAAAAAEKMMRPLLGLSNAIDLLNEKLGAICNFLILAAVVVSAGNAMIRYASATAPIPGSNCSGTCSPSS